MRSLNNPVRLHLFLCCIREINRARSFSLTGRYRTAMGGALVAPGFQLQQIKLMPQLRAFAPSKG
jgi:hypothetical protein